MTREELRAEIAMAICMVGCGIAAHRSDYFGEADAALSALEAAGVRLVPVEPSRHMLLAAHMVERDDIAMTEDEHRAMYAAFVAASPYAPPGG